MQQPSYENDEIRTHLAGMERVLVNTVKQLDKLTEEIVKLKQNMAVNSAPSATKTNPIENLASAQLTKMLKDNTNALKSIKEQTSDLKTELLASSRQASEIEKTVQSTKKELNQWHNSAFFKEDSLLIKDIHDCIANGKLAVNIEPTHPLNAPTHFLNAPTHPLNAPTHPLNAPTHPLNASTQLLNVPTHPINAPTQPLNAHRHSNHL